MSLTDWTPFRQLAKVYGATLSASAALAEIPALQGAASQRSEAALEEIRQAIVKLTPEPAPVPAYPSNIHEALGFRLILDRGSMVDRAVLDTGEWEPERVAYVAWLTERIRIHNPTFVDVGSYWGLYSLLAHRSGAFRKIVAVEADRHNFAQLQANLFLNGAARMVTCINKVASETNEPLSFRDSGSHADGNRAGTSVLPPASTLPSHKVDATTIDELLHASDEYILMKIDVEGFESYVLRGMRETAKRNKVVMQIEIFDEQKGEVFPELMALGLRQIHAIHPDYYYTNIPAEELGV